MHDQHKTLSRAARVVSALVVGSALAAEAGAAAWTRAEGTSLFSVPMVYSTADESFNEDGDRVDRLKFEIMEVVPTYEYGVTDELTFGLQPRYLSVEEETAEGDTVSNEGLAEAEVYLRKNLWRKDDAAFSTQFGLKVPIDPQEDHRVPLGRDQVDAEVNLMYGNRHRGESATFFYNVDVGYRKRFEEPDDQASLGAFAGVSVSMWTFLATADSTVGLDSPRFSSDEVLTAGRSFTRHKAGVALSYRLGDSFSVGANASRTWAGESVGAADYVGVSAFTLW